VERSVYRHALALMAYRRGDVDEDGEPTPEAVAGAIMEAETQRSIQRRGRGNMG